MTKLRINQGFIKRIKSKYRLVIMNEETFEEKASFNLRPLNVFVTVGLLSIALIILTIMLIAFTSLREYIPGYADVKMQRNVYSLTIKADSLARIMASQELYFQNLKNIIDGKIITDTSVNMIKNMVLGDSVHQLNKSIEDSLLRVEIESQDQYALKNSNANFVGGISGFLFFSPLKGKVTSRFDAAQKHYGIDVVSNPNEIIKATLDGTVVLSNFTSETGYVLSIQHSNNLCSVYKHCSALLKKTGETVNAGDAIAIIGNSGELSLGPHLHFELWYNGTPIDPYKYVSF